MFYQSSSAAAPEQITEIKRALKTLREADPEKEEYIQQIIERFPNLTAVECSLILSNIYGYMSGHISKNRVPLICPKDALNDNLNYIYL